MPTPSPPPPGHRAQVELALTLAARGWHIVPLSATTKRPLANCPTCREQHGRPAHRIEHCPCIPAGAWCHGVRAATTNPDRLNTWWRSEPAAIPGVAAGPSRLVLIDIDTHGEPLPTDSAELATALLPGIDLTTEQLPADAWRDPARFRDGRDTLTLLAHLRGGTSPWPAGAGHRPVTAVTPSGGRHLWYRAPAGGDLRQAIGALAWRVDIKAGWSYGVAPGARTRRGPYALTGGDLTAPGVMPDWLAREVTRVATTATRQPAQTPPRARASTATGGRRSAAYLTTVITNGAARLATLTDGRQRALAALAYQTGGLLAWSGLDPQQVTDQLIDAGTATGLPHRLATRIVHRSLTRGLAQPLPAPGTPHR